MSPTIEGDRLDRLSAWLDQRGLGEAGAPVETSFISGGAQNHIFEIRRGDLHGAIRIPPASAPADRDGGIVREWRIIEALEGTDVPHTAAIALCDDHDVLGRTFYIMGFVDGWSPMQLNRGPWPEPFNSDTEARHGLSYALVDGIALLSKVDWQAKGLDDLGRPDGFHDRQVDRWTSFFEKVKTREVEGFDEAAAWLRAHRPLDFVPGLMHGDYQFANVMFCHDTPTRLAAIVDWEMGTVGDPKLDLGWVMHNWGVEGGYVDVSNMPTADQMLARYSEVSGRQVDDIDYYSVLAKWKLAVVLERGFARATDDTPALQAFGPFVVKLMKEAAELASSTDYAHTA